MTCFLEKIYNYLYVRSAIVFLVGGGAEMFPLKKHLPKNNSNTNTPPSPKTSVETRTNCTMNWMVSALRLRSRQGWAAGDVFFFGGGEGCRVWQFGAFFVCFWINLFFWCLFNAFVRCAVDVQWFISFFGYNVLRRSWPYIYYTCNIPKLGLLYFLSLFAFQRFWCT